MLLDRYQENSWLFNANLKGKAGPGIEVYRGDLVLKEGEVADNLGRRKPPLVVSKEVAFVAINDKLKFIAGFIDEIQNLELVASLYGPDFADDLLAVFYVANIAKPMQVVVEGVNYVLIPLVQGMIWNELIDELRMEKSDFKGQSSEEKVVTLYESFKDYTPKSPVVPYEEAITQTVEAKRENWGAV